MLASERIAAWRAQRPLGEPLTVTVNISGRQLQDAALAVDVAEALRQSDLGPQSLILEMTESMLMQNTEATLTKLQELKALGVRLAIDDFGMGYSSLSYLHRFPIDILKIDKSFVERVGRGAEETALARAIITLGEALRLRTIAEGIEQAEQLAGLRSLGCELGQGYYFAAPLTRDDISALLTDSIGDDTQQAGRRAGGRLVAPLR